MNQTGWGYGGEIDAHLHNIAHAMKRAGFTNTDYIPPMERHVLARGYLTLENPKLVITNLLFPHPKKNPWCIDSPRPHLDCKPTHQTVANWEQSVLSKARATKFVLSKFNLFIFVFDSGITQILLWFCLDFMES